MIPFAPGRKVGIVVAENGCWNWTGYLTKKGYGQMHHGPYRWSTAFAHRVYYERAHGPVPEGKQLDHLCRNRRCVNPDHLEPVTSGENKRRSPLLKLSPESVRALRHLNSGGVSLRALAKCYGLSFSTVQLAVSGRNWGDVE